MGRESEFLSNLFVVKASFVLVSTVTSGYIWSPWVWWPGCVVVLCWWLSGVSSLAENVTNSRSNAATSEEFLECQNSGDQQGDLANNQGLQHQETESSKQDWDQCKDFESSCGDQWKSEFLDFGTTFNKIELLIFFFFQFIKIKSIFGNS